MQPKNFKKPSASSKIFQKPIFGCEMYVAKRISAYPCRQKTPPTSCSPCKKRNETGYQTIWEKTLLYYLIKFRKRKSKECKTGKWWVPLLGTITHKITYLRKLASWRREQTPTRKSVPSSTMAWAQAMHNTYIVIISRMRRMGIDTTYSPSTPEAIENNGNFRWVTY